MQEEITRHLKLVTKRIDKMAKESQDQKGFNMETSRLRLLTELVREQVEVQEIMGSPNNNAPL